MAKDELPPEPGEIPDLEHGIQGDFPDPPETLGEIDEPVEINDEEDEEDDDA